MHVKIEPMRGGWLGVHGPRELLIGWSSPPPGLKRLRENSNYKLSPEGTAESQSCPN
jgi:hypothetical protein